MNFDYNVTSPFNTGIKLLAPGCFRPGINHASIDLPLKTIVPMEGFVFFLWNKGVYVVFEK